MGIARHYDLTVGQYEPPVGGFIHGADLTTAMVGFSSGPYAGQEEGDLTDVEGVLSITSAGTYESIKCTRIDVARDFSGDVFIKGCLQQATVGNGSQGLGMTPRLDSGGPDVYVEHCTFDGQGDSEGIPVFVVGAVLDMRRSRCLGWMHGPRQYTHGHAYVNNYSEITFYPEGGHASAWSIYRNGQILGNVGKGGSTASLKLYHCSTPTGEFSLPDGCEIRSNLFDTPSVPVGTNFLVNFGLADGCDESAAAHGIEFVDNVIGQTQYSTGGSSGPTTGWTAARDGNVWANNRMADGTPVGTDT